VLERVSVMIWPVLPNKADEMRAQLGLPKIAPELGRDQWPRLLAVPSDSPLPPVDARRPLFPTYDKAEEAALLKELVPNEVAGEAPKASAPENAAPSKDTPISYEQFTSVDLRVGLVRTCERVPKKDKLLRLTVDLGETEPRQIVAGLALTFTPEALVGRRVVVVANLAPRDFGKGLVSHGMLLATGPSNALKLATVDTDVEPGAQLR
jgi:methionyl-tRNA synthetase